MSRVIVVLAEGFEEIEGLTVVDILRRAQIETGIMSVTGRKEVCGSHCITVTADCLFEEADIEKADMIVLPGGMPGTVNLRGHGQLCHVLLDFDRKKKYIAAICAAPSILGELGMLEGRRACAYPAFEDALTGAEVVDAPVVTDGHIVTGQGMGAAIPFALELTALLEGKNKAEEIRRAIVYRDGF